MNKWFLEKIINIPNYSKSHYSEYQITDMQFPLTYIPNIYPLD
jgi:hypothetical protein